MEKAKLIHGIVIDESYSQLSTFGKPDDGEDQSYYIYYLRINSVWPVNIK
jgi:hypothetical protein